MKINITPTSNPVPVAEREKRVAEPGFGKYFTDHMVTAQWNQGSGWSDASVQAYGPISLDPAAMVFHYGQEIFEGMKAYSQPDGSIALFRPEANGLRFAKSAARITLPELPVADFVSAVEALVRIDSGWVPKKVGESLYIRPFMIATEVGLGVRPSNQALFAVIATPAAAYFNAAKAVQFGSLQSMYVLPLVEQVKQSAAVITQLLCSPNNKLQHKDVIKLFGLMLKSAAISKRWAV
jgi:branched-chain amino acid aminotransferase